MKEESDNIEREFKFAAPVQHEAILSPLLALMRPSWRLVWSARMVIDIYFDAECLPLLRTGATFRLRRRRAKPGWTANFKPPPNAGRDYWERREVRTTLSIDEALRFQTGEIPGHAASLALQWIDDVAVVPSVGRSPHGLRPMVGVISHRHSYTVRPGAIDDFSSNMIDVVIEDVTASDLRDCDIRPLVRSGVLDWSRPRPTASFRIAEIEALAKATPREEMEALDLTTALARELFDNGLTTLTHNKYREALSRLGVCPERESAGVRMPVVL